MEVESRMEGCQGLEAGGNGSYLTGTEFQFCQMKIWWMAGGVT